MWAKAERIFDGLAFAATGAYGALWYVDGSLVPGVPKIHLLRQEMLFVWFLLMALRSVIQVKKPQAGTALKEPSPAFSAAAVIMLTGGVAASYIGLDGFERDGHGDYPVAIAILIVSLAAALLAGRWAHRHAGEIGEARFPNGG